RPEPGGNHPSFESGGRAALDAGDLGVPRHLRCDRKHRGLPHPAAARRAGDARARAVRGRGATGALGARPMNGLSAAQDCIAAGDPAVLVTVAEAKGSTPRESGAKMLVRAHDIVGSIGGGQLELLAIDAARRMITGAARRPDLMRYSLGPD